MSDNGEGLIWAVRDPQDQDPGAQDKRLLVVEPEFASVLKATSREISTLSPTLRSAWDGRPLALLTRTAPATATQAHIAIIGHITQTELARHTTTIELANGFEELTDAAVQRARFEADREQRRLDHLPLPEIDQALLDALAAGLPAVAGVALGFDRLLMLRTGASDISAVLAFALERA